MNLLIIHDIKSKIPTILSTVATIVKAKNSTIVIIKLNSIDIHKEIKVNTTLLKLSKSFLLHFTIKYMIILVISNHVSMNAVDIMI